MSYIEFKVNDSNWGKGRQFNMQHVFYTQHLVPSGKKTWHNFNPHNIIGNPFGFSSFLLSQHKFHRVKYNSIRTKRNKGLPTMLSEIE